eukprot:m.10429 g.10429  ORF g.10429 m.10429 type:complete len:470 (-) comp5562_c0_seq1:3148-4557(-)
MGDSADPLLAEGLLVNNGEFDSEVAKDEKKGNSWFSSSSIIVANMLGAGVLGLPFACRQLGWLSAALVLTFMTTYSIYGGLLLGKLRRGNKHIESYGELAKYAGSLIGEAGFWQRFCNVVGYTYVLGSLTIYLTTMKISLMEIFQKCPSAPPGSTTTTTTTTTTVGPHPAVDCGSTQCSDHLGMVEWKDIYWLLITVAIVYPLTFIKSMSDTGIVSYLGVGTIAFVNIVILENLISESTTGNVVQDHSIFPENLQDFVDGMTQLTFAFGGHVLMVDIQASMHTPSHWPKSIYSSQLFMAANYAIVGFLGYYVYGQGVSSIITASLKDNGLRAAVNACLFIHVAVAYAINSNVMARYFVNKLWPRVLDNPKMSYFQQTWRWVLVSTLIMFVAGLIGSLIPFFSNLMNVYSSIGIMSLSFFVPTYLWARTTHMRKSSYAFHMFLLVLCVGGLSLGMWGAIKSIIYNMKTCK